MLNGLARGIILSAQLIIIHDKSNLFFNFLLSIPRLTQKEMMMSIDVNCCQILRISDVVALTNLSRSTIYVLVKSGLFPRQIKIGGCACWLRSDVHVWIENKFNGNNTC